MRLSRASDERRRLRSSYDASFGTAPALRLPAGAWRLPSLDAPPAATVARAAGVGLLALTHISSRYFGRDVRREAETVFPNTVVPKDFDTIEVPFEERGAPRLVKGGALRQRGSEAPADPVSSLP